MPQLVVQLVTVVLAVVLVQKDVILQMYLKQVQAILLLFLHHKVILEEVQVQMVFQHLQQQQVEVALVELVKHLQINLHQQVVE
jgi:hypothetical protein